MRRIIRWTAALVFFAIIAASLAPSRLDALIESYRFDRNAWSANVQEENFECGPGTFAPAFGENAKALVTAYHNNVMDRRDIDRRAELREPLPEDSTKREQLSLDIEKQRDAVEIIMAAQVAWALNELGIVCTDNTQNPPEVIFGFLESPKRLIISSRDEIRRKEAILLRADLSPQEIDELEALVEKELGASSLVVIIGGISLNPVMVNPHTRTPRVTLNVIAHEWTHRYLNGYRLGSGSNDTIGRAIQETVAGIVSNEVGMLAYQRFYDTAYEPPSPQPRASSSSSEFNANAVLRETYERSMALLAEGKILQAEAYMNERRDFLEENGYFIRRINQAYFAFYGSYAGSSTFENVHDGAGAKLKQLREKSPNIATFLVLVRGVRSVSDIDKLLDNISK